MTNRVLLKRSSVANSVPASGNLEYGELALNYTDGNLFFKTASNAVTLIASTQTANYSGNVTADYFLGNIIGETGNLETLAVSGNVVTTGNISATGNAYLGNVDAALGKFGNVEGTIRTSFQPDITVVGNLISLTVTGNLGAGNISATNISGTLTTAAQPNITSVGNLTSLNVTSNVSVGNVIATGNLSGTISSPSQPYITDLGTLNSLGVAGNVSVGNLTTLGNVDANYFIGNGSQLTGISTTTSEIFNGNSNVSIDSAGANVTMDVNGDANTVVISPGSIFVNGIFASPKTITSNVQMAADSTSMVISPLTIANGYSMSIPTSSTVYIWIPS